MIDCLNEYLPLDTCHTGDNFQQIQINESGMNNVKLNLYLGFERHSYF